MATLNKKHAVTAQISFGSMVRVDNGNVKCFILKNTPAYCAIDSNLRELSRWRIFDSVGKVSNKKIPSLLKKNRKDAFRTFFESNFSEICSTVIFRALMNPSERGKVWAKPGQWTSLRGTLVLKPHNETQIGGTRSLTKILSSGQLVFQPTSD